MQDRTRSQEDYVKDSFAIPTTVSHSIYTGFAGGRAGVSVGVNNLFGKEFSESPRGLQLKQAVEASDIVRNDPNISWPAWLGSEGAGMIGAMINPRTWPFLVAAEATAIGATTGAGALLTKAFPKGVGMFARAPLAEALNTPLTNWLPTTIGREAEKKTLSLALLGERGTHAFTNFAGFSIPQDIAENYEQDTGHINWGGVMKSAGKNGAIGLAIDTVPFAWGVVRSKINLAREAAHDAKVDVATVDYAIEKGHITKEQGEWAKEYLHAKANPKDTAHFEKVKTKATELVAKTGQKVNTATHEVPVDFIKPETMHAFQGAFSDQLAADLPEPHSTALTDFLVHNDMDRFKNDPNSTELNGVRGAVDHIGEKLKEAPRKLKEADAILDKYIERGLKENMIMSQKELFKNMRQSGFESSHMTHLPITMPENLLSHIKTHEKIKHLERKLAKDRRKGLPENKQTQRRIDELRERQAKIQTPKEELHAIRKNLITENGLPKNWESSNAYHRLLDLAHFWGNAKSLLDRIHLEAAYERQRAFKTIADQVLRHADSDLPKSADPEAFYNYLRQRMEKPQLKVQPIEELTKEFNESQKVPENAEQILEDQAKMNEHINAEDAKADFEAATEKLKEFRSSENVFKNMFDCVMGKLLNG
jgi:hypothetical protein